MSRISSPKAAFAATTIALMVGLLTPSHALAQTIRMPASAQEMEAIYEARTDSARSRFSAADVEFVSSMIHHHAQAITMAEMAPTHGASPTIQTLAARIINSQRDEISTMGRWLAERGQPVPQLDSSGEDAGGGGAIGHSAEMGHGAGTGVPGPAMHGAADHAAHMASGEQQPAPTVTSDSPVTGSTDVAASGHSHAAAAQPSHDHSAMAGMLTPEQMATLDAARGEEFDRLFLAMMIFHHRGAVTMVDDLFASDDALQDVALFKLASDIQAEQTSEIDRMNRMLVEMTGSPLGPAILEIR